MRTLLFTASAVAVLGTISFVARHPPSVTIQPTVVQAEASLTREEFMKMKAEACEKMGGLSLWEDHGYGWQVTNCALPCNVKVDRADEQAPVGLGRLPRLE